MAVTSFTEDGKSQGGSEELSVGTQGALPCQWPVDSQGQVTCEGVLPITGLSSLPSVLYVLYIGSACKYRTFGLPQPSGYRGRAQWGPLFPISESCLLYLSPQGKFIRINFDVNGYIVGANIETCILVAD